MADYRELLRKAVEALPDNTGANRRAVYEKARAALVAQLRAVEPPLPAREITQQRLKLEDCIREVEQSATEQLLSNLRGAERSRPSAGSAPSAPSRPSVRSGPSRPEPAQPSRPMPSRASAASQPSAPSRPRPASRASAPSLPVSAPSRPQPQSRTSAPSRPAQKISRPSYPDHDAYDAQSGYPEEETWQNPYPQAGYPADSEPDTFDDGFEAAIEDPTASGGDPYAPDYDEESAAPAAPSRRSAPSRPASASPGSRASRGSAPSRPAPPPLEDEFEDEPAPEAVEPEPRARFSPFRTGIKVNSGFSRSRPSAPERQPDRFDAVAEGEDGPFDDGYDSGPLNDDGQSIEEIIAAAEAASRSTASRPSRAATRFAPPGGLPLRGPAEQLPIHQERDDFDPLPDASRAYDIRNVSVDMRGREGAVSDAAASAAYIGQAMSSVREVDLDANGGQFTDAQVAIDRAIATLDREARGDLEAAEAARSAAVAPVDPDRAPARSQSVHAEAEPGDVDPLPDAFSMADETPFAEARGGRAAVPAAQARPMAGAIGAEGDHEAEDDEDDEDDEEEGRRGFGALSVFLLIAVLLLAGGGVGGFWAWREGYIDLSTVFAQGDTTEPLQQQEVAAVEEEPEPLQPETPEPGNTTPDVPPVPEAVAEDGEAGAETETPDSTANGAPDATFNDRLPTETAPEPLAEGETTEGDVAAVVPADGPQSLLLEEQANGAAGAVPYSGSVEWARGTDELGHPTIIGEASIPARNLDVRILLRRNSDSNLPASHLMEVNFTVAESFVGGNIANLPGVLLKDEELVQGQPLTGASARIVGNSFLFALSGASDQDVANNRQLLRERAWMDLAMVYGTGRRAIITLEKSDEGAAIFDSVMDAWAELDAEAAPATSDPVDTGDAG
ncbi:hypothetical protein [Pelagibacterium montanilacus]|uniref:hypothetical protein n=1 Tax=Pelagibacterium montanilacus TaxID=2185280 RepID=UPI000F8CDC77|nr:hypothetical protein [Pelagibacterium montanilacus]